MKKIGYGLAALMLLAPIQVLAEGNNYGSSEYLQQGVGARALGMGGAFVALANDATAGYWNPAGLAQMDLYMYEVGSQYAMLSNQMTSSYLSYALQWPEVGNFEIGWINLNSGEIERRTEAGLVDGTFYNTENAVIFSYGTRVYGWMKGLSVGANLKLLQQSLGGFSAVGHGLDLGALWQPVLYLDHTLGVTVQNIFQRLYWSTPENNLDFSLLNVKAGACLKFFPSQENLYFNHLLTTVDLEFSEYERFKLRLGAEYWFIRSLAARLGYDGQGLTMGASYNSEYYEVDYAFRYDPGDLQAHQHRVSLLLRLPGEVNRDYLPAAESREQPAVSPVLLREKPAAAGAPALPATPAPTPASTLKPTPEPTPAPTPEPTSEPTPEPTPIPTVQSPQMQPTLQITPSLLREIEKPAPDEPHLAGSATLQGPLNNIYFNPLGFVTGMFGATAIYGQVEYERAVSEQMSLALAALYFVATSTLVDFNYYLLGPGITVRYYFSPENGVQDGIWAGPTFSYVFGGMRNQEGYVIDEIKVEKYTFGGEVGYKWYFGDTKWLVVSPFLGMFYYDETDKYTRSYDSYVFAANTWKSTELWITLGVNIGVAF